MKLLPHQIGKEAEDQAVAWFLDRGNYKLLARNYRCKMGEIDMIFEDSQEGKTELVFVEVKARAESAMVDGLQSVDWKKQLKLKRAISHFLSKYNGPAKTIRLDLLYRTGTEWKHLTHLW